MATQGPFVVYIKPDGSQELRPMPRLGQGGGNGTTIVNTSGGIPTLQVQVLTATGQVQAVKQRNLLVLLRLAVNGTITLPALGDVTVGSRITFVRESGDGVPAIDLKAPATDKVNGITNEAPYTPYLLRSLQDSVTYLRVPDGWQREQGTPARVIVDDVVTPLSIPAGPEGTQYVISRRVGQGQANLPPAAECREGFRVVILNGGTAWLDIVPDGTDEIDRSTELFTLPAESTAILECIGPRDWVSVAQNQDQIPITSSDATIDVPAFRGFGRQTVRATNAAATVNLPNLGDLAVGASILVENAGSGVVTIVSDAPETINGQASRTVPLGRACNLVSWGNEWIATDGGFWPTDQVAADDPLTITAWVDSPKFVESTSAVTDHVIRLPAVSSVAYGAQVVIWNNSAEPASLQGQLGETINGATSFAIPANTAVSIWKRGSATNWMALLGA